MGRSICTTINLANGLKLPDRELSQMLIDDDDRTLSAAEVRRLFTQKLSEGFIVLPICDRHDARGYCQGHEQ
jgi:hypothetical protein